MSKYDLKDVVMKNLKENVKIFTKSLNDVVYKTNLFDYIGNMNYLQYCIYNAMFCLIEMEKSEGNFPSFPAKDQNQISFWIVQMRAEAKRILKDNFIIWYKLVKQG